MGRKRSHSGGSSSNPRPYQKTMHPDLSRLVGLEIAAPPRLIRTDSKSFEQFPIRSGPSKALLEHLPDQAGFLVGLNVLESVQDLPNDLQVRRPFADSAPALKARD